jgi:hypothetical protein
MSESDSTGNISTESPSAEQIMELVKDELLYAPNAYKPGASGKRYFWPENDEIIVTVAGLPEDCSDIEVAIREYMGYVADDGHLRFPVKEVEFNRDTGRIRIIGDPSRISEMRQLPRH